MCMIFLIFFSYLLLLLNKIQINGIVNISLKTSENNQLIRKSNDSTNYDEPILFDSTGGRLEEELDEAINDNEYRFIDLENNQLKKTDEKPLSRLTDDFLVLELEEVNKDDANVPSLLDTSVSEKSDDNDNFERISLPISSLSYIDEEIKYFSLDKVPTGRIPPGIIVQDYSYADKMKLIHLYQSTKLYHTKELLTYIAQHIHNKYMNCLVNFQKWIINPSSGEPIFYRNCVPCTNAVDLNLQSLFNHQTNTTELQHYFVNTCNMEKQWVSYISNMEYLHSDLKTHSVRTFTDIIHNNLIPNHRYVVQGIVKSDRIKYHRDFFHVCNLINDEYGHVWIIDGQIERVFDLNESNDLIELNKRYRADYVARASTGLFRPPEHISHAIDLST